MCTNKGWAVVVLFLLAIFPKTAFCQEIKGDTVFTSATQQTVLYFPSKVTSVAYEEKSGFARFDTIIDNSLVSLRAKVVNAAPTVLNITEGNRSHSIVLAYKPELTNAELHHDWNDINELSRFVSASDKKSISSSTKTKKQNLAAKNFTNPSANVVDNNSGEDDYNNLLIQSYDLVQKKNFAESKRLYDKAMTLKDKKFNDDLTKANGFFAAKNYEEAKITYLLALSIKPDDAFARRRLKESQRLSQTSATASANTAAKATESNNTAAINQPEKIPIVKKTSEKINSDTNNKLLNVSTSLATNNNPSKKLDENKKAETNAAIIQPEKIPIVKKPSENIKSQQVALTEPEKTESQVASTQSAQEQDFDEEYTGNDKYDSAVAQATKLFNNKSYAEALVLYKKARELKPNEDLAPKMIRFVNEVMSHLPEEQKRDKDLKNKARIIEIKDLGTEAIVNKDWQKAKELYTEMLTLHPIKNDEDFARKKIETIDLQLEKLANIKPVEKEPEVVIAPPKNRREARERRLLAERNAILASGSKNAATQSAQTTATSINYAVPVSINKNATLSSAAAGSEGKISFWTINQFKTDFKNADSVQWTITPNFYKVNFVQDEDKVEAFYDVNNVLIGTSRSINAARLPAVARKNFIKSYPAYTITEVIYFEGADQLAYYISAQQGKEKVVLKALAENNYRLQPVKDLSASPDNTIALNSAVKDNKSTMIKELMGKALKESNNKNWENAKKTYEQVLSLQPGRETADFATKKIEIINLEMQIAGLSDEKANQKSAKKEKAADQLLVPAAVMADKTAGKNIVQTMQASAIPYTSDELMKKYATFNFNEMPDGQMYDSTDIKNRLVHYDFCKKVLAAPVQLSLADSNNDVKVVCQNIVFNGKNAYLKLLIENKSLRSDFLTGMMQLSLLKSNGLLQKYNPDFISDFPVVMPQKEFAVVYVTDDFTNVNPSDIFYLEISDRTKKNKLTIAIPANIYLKQKSL